MNNNPDCTQYPFDYWKHIVVKNIITPRYRWFTEFFDLFQAVEVVRCDRCMVEGYSNLSLPFKFDDMTSGELHCTLKRMGLKELEYTDIEIMPTIDELDDIGNYCEHCFEIVEEEIENGLSED